MASCSLERTRFVETMRAFYSGRITNDQMEDASSPLCKTDQTVHEVFSQGVWGTYSDNREYKLTGKHTLTSEDRTIVARWILFLKSGQPYKWPLSRGIHAWVSLTSLLVGIMLALWTWNWAFGFLVFGPLVLVTMIHCRLDQRRIYRNGDIKVWPFICRDDFEEALRHPPYLAGKAASQ